MYPVDVSVGILCIESSGNDEANSVIVCQKERDLVTWNDWRTTCAKDLICQIWYSKPCVDGCEGWIGDTCVQIACTLHQFKRYSYPLCCDAGMHPLLMK